MPTFTLHPITWASLHLSVKAHCAEQPKLMEQALADVDTEVLVAELKRRLDCQTKPEKHVILIGAQAYC